MRYKTFIFLWVVVLITAQPAGAVTLPWTQSSLDTFNMEFGGATLYRAVAPADPLGLIGFDIGVEATSVTIDGQSFFIPKIKFQKGLFAGVDISGHYSQIPTSGITGISSDGTMYGVALSYAIWEGGPGSPALALRGSYTSAEIPLVASTTTYGVDLAISKGLGPLTPYAGIGLVQLNTTDDSGGGLTSSSQQNRYFYGFNLNLVFMDLALESDTMGDVQSYSLKAGFRF